MSVPAYIFLLSVIMCVIDQVCYAHLRVLRTGVQPLPRGLLLRDPERGAIPRDASSLRLLNGRDLCEASRRSRLSRAAKGGLSRGGIGLHFWDWI